jgi:hypothetical protein
MIIRPPPNDYSDDGVQIDRNGPEKVAALKRLSTVSRGHHRREIRQWHQTKADYRQRIPIEGKFGQGKQGYSLNTIHAKTARTSEAWIHSIFLVMNLLVLVRHFLVQ